ncbi:MAG: 6-phosphofructokinase [Clostridia bacterium]|nr:6-phosphofructokinase [Clostridia bacterium]MDE6759023.1 6-phosphofructokinase [Clostridia bacterium]MDE7078588.1 6-phosphofructokinase [Clostridia bacterium]
MKRIGVLTSGGDAPGMNACVRAVVRYAIYNGMTVYGIERGYTGLINNNIKEMNKRSVSDIIQRGGTILKTARCPEFVEDKYMQIAVDNMEAYGIDGLVVIGGDGSFRGALDLYKKFGVKAIGIPGTIDNDLAYTDYTLGFDTSVNTVVSAINNLRDTMTSHDRVCIIEVMGRKCGDIALYAGICGGAEIILVPEVPFDLKQIVKKINLNQRIGKSSDIIVLAEGVCKAETLKEQLAENGITGSIKTTTLGYIQRGGAPTMADRVLSARCAVRAVDLLMADKGGRVVGIKDNKIIDVDIEEALTKKGKFDDDLYQTAMILGL